MATAAQIKVTVTLSRVRLLVAHAYTAAGMVLNVAAEHCLKQAEKHVKAGVKVK
jgi:hypothetical protein